jgi:hypothetical protein
MQLFSHFTANNLRINPMPFRNELSMGAYLIENSQILSLDSDSYSCEDILEAELSLKNGRKSKNTDGRLDILCSYQEKNLYGIIELKKDELKEEHLDQLTDYLEAIKNNPGNNVLRVIKDQDDLDVTPKFVGVLIGSSINEELARKIKKGNKFNDIPIAAITIQRFRGDDGQIYVWSDSYVSKYISSGKDTTKYILNGDQSLKLGKNRMVLEVVKLYIKSNPHITFSELEDKFPKNIGGGRKGVFSLYEDIEEKDMIRFFTKDDEMLKLKDADIAVSTQWGIHNINNFINRARELGFKIKEVR